MFNNLTGYIEPKTDWTSSDKFNITDYNRILNNIDLLTKTVSKIQKTIETEYMGSKIAEDGFSSYWDVNIFNAFENNIESINKAILNLDYGSKKTFYENGVFIDWQELNRIENAILDMLDLLDRQMKTLEKLDFRLGNFKGIRV